MVLALTSLHRKEWTACWQTFWRRLANKFMSISPADNVAKFHRLPPISFHGDSACSPVQQMASWFNADLSLASAAGPYPKTGLPEQSQPVKMGGNPPRPSPPPPTHLSALLQVSEFQRTCTMWTFCESQPKLKHQWLDHKAKEASRLLHWQTTIVQLVDLSFPSLIIDVRERERERERE